MTSTLALHLHPANVEGCIIYNEEDECELALQASKIVLNEVFQ
jgi:hypothetical protein